LVGNMMNGISIGIMQGRLLPPIDGRLQAFPGKNWEDEFILARQCGLDAIELIFDEGEEYNPLHSDDAIDRLQAACTKHKIKALSVCADYFMTKGFLRVTEGERKENIKTLVDLTLRCAKAGIRYIIIPFVDGSEVKNENELESVRKSLIAALERTNGCNVVYALEMSLPARRIASFLEDAKHLRLKVNYDMGNSTAFGYDVVTEIERLSPWIVDVHIKDRKVGGGSHILGEGDTDFDGAFDALAKRGFKGPFILQAQRGGDEAELIKRYLKFVRRKIEEHYYAKRY